MISSGVISVHRHVAGDEDHRAVLAEGAGEASAKPVSNAGSERRQERPARRSASARAPSSPRPLRLRRRVLEHRLHRAHDERQADEVSATTTPSGVNATLMPSGPEAAPIQPFCA